ncbi:MAG: TonB-dependent receptor [Candidatus Azobacteroides sp.]|nr:TonB-dependent receptor [Candidatus Azobacteroides sp.]
MNKSKAFLTGVIFFFLSVEIITGQTLTLKGKVFDSETNETLTGVPILVKERDAEGTNTSVKGEYTLHLPKGKYTLRISYLGYETTEVDISLNEAMVLDIPLRSSSTSLEEVVVSATRADENVTAPQTGMEKFIVEEINLLPVLLGERDVIKIVQLTPGVKSASEGGSGFFVRGGTADQNLILLDNISLYNASHLMGFFSTFNSDIVRDVTLYKGAMPGQYGERLSSILDVQQRNGDLQDYHISGGIGLISSKINAEGPIQKGKSTFILGARRTYADAIARLSGVEEAQNAYLYFYDLNAKLNFALSEKDQLSFSGYWGNDKMKAKEVASVGWGNLVGAVRWTRQMNPAWTSNTSLSFNRYKYDFEAELGSEIEGKSVIKDWGFKQDMLYYRNENNEWRFGLHSTYHGIAPGDYDFGEEDVESRNLYKRYSLENGIYATNQVKFSDRLEIVYGLRLSAFFALGDGQYYEMNEHKEITDSIWYKSGKIVKSYFNLEPRISGAFRLNDVSSLKAAYARTTQNMHLLTYAAQGTPFDRWISSSNNIKPQIADQVSLGYFRNFGNNMFEFSIESYYKNMQHQLDYKDNPETMGYDVVETELLEGKGRAYGVELLLKKKTGKLTGWIGYTLSKSEKKIDGINNDRWYNAYQDRTHDISIVGVYALNKKWTLSAAWVYYTGNAITYPSGKWQVDGKEIVYYAERNGYRAPAYHRLDLGATCLLKKTNKYTSELAFSLYNAYGRENAYYINFRTNDDDPTKSTAYQYSLFRFVPSVSWNFKF